MSNNNNAAKKPLVSDLTDEQIQDYKARRGDLTQIHVFPPGYKQKTDDSAELDEAAAEKANAVPFIICVPSRTVIDRVAELGVKKQIVEVNKCLIANCVIAGDMELLERDGNVYADVLSEIQKLQQHRVVLVKKL